MKLMNNPEDTIQFDFSNRSLVFFLLFLFSHLKYNSAKMQLLVVWITKQFQLKVKKKTMPPWMRSVWSQSLSYSLQYYGNTVVFLQYALNNSNVVVVFQAVLSCSLLELPVCFLNIMIPCLQSLKRGQGLCLFHSLMPSQFPEVPTGTLHENHHVIVFFCVCLVCIRVGAL